MIVSVASGKGGTGKTLVATSLARSFDDVAFIDADVEGANAHLFLRPEISETREAKVEVPCFEAELCTECGRCAEYCRFNAIAVVGGKAVVFPELCHSCGVCIEVCEPGALTSSEASLGEVHLGTFGDRHPYAYGELAIGQVRAATLIEEVKRAGSNEAGVTVIDAPPGTSCATVESVRGSDYCLLVTEPTPFGLHDLVASLGVLAEMGIPCGVLINRVGLGAADIEGVCEEWQVPVVGRIPFDEKIARWTSAGDMLVDRSPRYATFFGRLARQLVRDAPTATPPVLPPTPAGLELTGTLLAPTGAGPRSSAPQCVVISGKGGTGKTMVTSAIVAAGDGALAVDCDVDAANLHLVLRAKCSVGRAFEGAVVARIDPELCTGCGTCVERCHFNAIETGPAGKAVVDELRCEGCGLCSLVCPEMEEGKGPVALILELVGTIMESETQCGPLVHAELALGAEASGRLVTELRHQARASADVRGSGELLLDGPPGTGCPVNASVVDTDLGLVVTEPGVSARHDLERALRLLGFLGVPAAVVINKCDINDRERERLEAMAERYGAPVLARIPFDRSIVDALVRGTPPVLSQECVSREVLQELAREVEERLRSLSVAEGRR